MFFCLLVLVDIDYHFERDVTSHVVHSTTAGKDILVGIFQPVHVILVGFVQQVVGGDVEFSDLAATQQDIRSCRE